MNWDEMEKHFKSRAREGTFDRFQDLGHGFEKVRRSNFLQIFFLTKKYACRQDVVTAYICTATSTDHSHKCLQRRR